MKVIIFRNFVVLKSRIYDWEKYNDDRWCRKQRVSMEQIDIIIANVLGEVSL